jgi:hypothetical protein
MTPSGPEQQQQSTGEGHPARGSEVPLCDDVACWKCEYNLRGIATDQRCPECGETAEDTLAWRFRLSDPDWLKDVSKGMLLAIEGLGLMFISLVFVIPATGFAGGKFGLLWVMALCCSMLLVSARGFSMVTEPDPSELGFSLVSRRTRMLQKAARLILVRGLRVWTVLALVPVSVALFDEGNQEKWGETAGGCFLLGSLFVCVPIAGLGLACLAGYEITLAQRLDRLIVRTWFRRFAIGTTIAVVILVLSIAASFGMGRHVVFAGVAAWVLPVIILFRAHIDLAKKLRRAAGTISRSESRLDLNAGTWNARASNR